MRYKSVLNIASVISILILSSSNVMAFDNIGLNKSFTNKGAIYVKNKEVENLEDKATLFISNLLQEGLEILKNKKLSDKKRKERFGDLLHNNFDMKTIARFSLGRYWRTSSKSEQEEYLKLFEDMIINVYSKRFNSYDGQEIKVTSARKEGKFDAIVSSIIIPKTGSEIDVDWRVRQKKNGDLKVIDIIVEGVSMSMTQRSDFASVIQRGGGKVEVLLAHLRNKI